MLLVDENHKLSNLMSKQHNATEEPKNKNKMTIFKAKQECQQASNNTDLLKNRVNHIIFKQNQTNQKIYHQNQKAISLFKEKQKTEKQKEDKIKRNQEEKVKLNNLIQQCQLERSNRRENILENQKRVQDYKKNRKMYIKSEMKDMERQVEQQQQLDLKYNRMKANLVKDRLQESRANIHKFWEKKLQYYDLSKNYEVMKNEHYRKQKENVNRQLENKEQDLIFNLRNTMNQKSEACDKYQSIQHMSTQQFKGKYPQFFEQIDLNLQIEELMQSTESNFRSFSSNKNQYDKYNRTGLSFKQQLNLKNKHNSKKIQKIYMINQDPFQIVK